MENLEKSLKRHFSFVKNHLIALCLLLGIGLAGSQANAQLPADSTLHAVYYFKVDGEVMSEITLQPGDTITVVSGVTTNDPVDGVTVTLLWDPALLTGYSESGMFNDLIGSNLPSPFGDWSISNNWTNNPNIPLLGHVSISKAQLGGQLQPNSDEDGNPIDTNWDVASFDVIVNSDVEFDTAVIIRHQIIQNVSDWSAITNYGRQLQIDDEIPEFTIHIDATQVIAPENDEACDAIDLVCGDELAGSLEGATISDFGSPDCSSDEIQADVFYTFDAEPGQLYTVTIVNSDGDIDGVLSFYSYGCSTDGSATLLGCIDMDDGPFNSLDLTVDTSTVVHVLYNADEGNNFTITLACEDISVPTYCTPEGTNSNRYINNFSTTTGSQNITNELSGYSLGGYGDFTTLIVEQGYGGTINFEADVEGGLAGFSIWVDWNQDGEFDIVNEVAYESSGNNVSHSGSFTLPGDALEGSTRMRIVSHWLSTSGSIDPCATGFTYGEFEDYTFNVSSEAAWDCSELEANIGDACDDNNDSTENDVITEYCECAGTPVQEAGCVNTSLWPSNSVTPNDDGSFTSINSCNFFGDYSIITGVLGGHEYVFTGQENSSGNLAYITVRSGTSAGSVVVTGTSPLIMTASDNADLFIHWSADENCNNGSQCATTSVTCITCSVDSAVALNGNVNWNNSCDDRAGTVKLYTPNMATLIETYTITLTVDGSFTIEDLPTGNYDVIVKIQGYLAKGIQDVVISAGANSLAVDTIKFGDVDNNNSLNFLDVSALAGVFGSLAVEPGYNPLADANCDGIINFLDVSALSQTFQGVTVLGANAPLGN